MKHTKGKWINNDGCIEVDGNPLPSRRHYYSSNGDVKEIFGHSDLFKEGEANDRLKAAAPELLEALINGANSLEKAIKALERKDFICDYTKLNAMKEAIKKATE